MPLACRTGHTRGQPTGSPSPPPRATAARLSHQAGSSNPAQSHRASPPATRPWTEAPASGRRSTRAAPRAHSSPYFATAAASPSACSAVTVSTRNGPSSIAAVPAESRSVATRSAVPSRPARDPIFFQNGATDSAALRACPSLPAAISSPSSRSAHSDPASARAANARSRHLRPDFACLATEISLLTWRARTGRLTYPGTLHLELKEMRWRQKLSAELPGRPGVVEQPRQPFPCRLRHSSLRHSRMRYARE